MRFRLGDDLCGDRSMVPGAPAGYPRWSPGVRGGLARPFVTTEELQDRARLGDRYASRRLEQILSYVTAIQIL